MYYKEHDHIMNTKKRLPQSSHFNNLVLNKMTLPQNLQVL